MMLPKVAVAIAALALGVDAGTTVVPPTHKKHHKHKECTPVNLIQNPSFDDPNSAGVYDGSPWNLDDSFDPTVTKATIIDNPAIARTGDHAAFFDLDPEFKLSSVSQIISGLTVGTQYQLIYYYRVYVGQPNAANASKAFLAVDNVRYDNPIVAPIDRGTYFQDETIPTPTASRITVQIGVACDAATDSFEVAVDDVSLYEEDPNCPLPTTV